MTASKMCLTFHFPICGNTTELQHRSLMAKGDIDNFAKFVQDALQDDFYPNDKQILHLHAKKVGHVNIAEGWTHVIIARVRNQTGYIIA